MKYDVFISCKSEDYPLAEEVYNHLISKGYTVFLSSQVLETIGEAEYSDAIFEALDDSYHLLVVASSAEYIKSKWVKEEWNTFYNEKLSGRKPGQIMTLLKGVSVSKIPIQLRHYESFTMENYKTRILSYVKTPDYLEREEAKENLETPEFAHNEQKQRQETTCNNRIITYTASKKLNLEASRFTPAFTSHTFDGETGTITFPKDVTSIGEKAFEWCSSLNSITIPNSVTSIGDAAFYNCNSLQSITIPNSVTSIGDVAFYNCKSLQSITIPNSVTSIGESAFCACTSLQSITIPNSVTSIGNEAFSSCNSLQSITIPNSVTSIGGGVLNGCERINKIVIESSKYYTESEILISNEGELISCWTKGSHITIPNSVTSIGERAFNGCTGLTAITIPNSVTSIGGLAFDECKSLQSITIPNSVTSIGDVAFYNCKSLQSITIPNSVTSIGDEAFGDCTSLREIRIPRGTRAKFERMVGYDYKDKLVEVD